MDLVEYRKSKQERHFWELARIRFIKLLLKRYISITTPMDAADIGCGDCYAVSELMLFLPFRKIWAKDPFLKDPLLSELRTRFPQIIFDNTATGSDLSLMPRSDICFMLDVLEHIEQDHEFLVSVNRRLNENGILLVTVPAYNFLFSDHDVFLKHYRRYNKKELCRQLSDASFTVLGSGYFFFSLVLIRFLQKVFHVKDRNDIGKDSIPVFNSLLAGFLLLDARIGFFLNRIGIRLPGLSCWAVAAKNKSAESGS